MVRILARAAIVTAVCHFFVCHWLCQCARATNPVIRPPLDRVQGKSDADLCWLDYEQAMLAQELKENDPTALVLLIVWADDNADYEVAWPGNWLFCYRRIPNPGFHGRKGDDCKLGFTGNRPFFLQLRTSD